MVKRFARGFISNGEKGKEGGIAKRPRESVCKRQSIAARER